MYRDARYLMVAMKELSSSNIQIGNEVSDEDLAIYDKTVHEEVFPPQNPADVKEIAGDGNQKVLIKACKHQKPLKRIGRPKKGLKALKNF